jgi:hypothetical protein
MSPQFQDLFDRLRRIGPSAVPVIGAGMAVACGAPGPDKLAKALSEAAGEHFPPDRDLFDIADALEAQHGVAWVQQRTAEAINAVDLVPSRAMLAVTLVPSRVIATTNYDDAIEIAARRHGLRPVTLLPASTPQLLGQPDDDELFVVHLHGVAREPHSIILTSSSYVAAAADEALQLAVRTLAASKTLVFLGHSLAAREAHLRRDVRRIVELFGAGKHLLLSPEGAPALGDMAVFEAETGVHPEPFPNPHGDFEFVVRVARTLGAPPLQSSTVPLPLWPDPVEAAYEPLPLAPAAEVPTDEERAIWLYGSYFRNEPIHAETLTDEFRLLLVGQPGVGKTQTMLRLAASSPQDAVYIRLGAVTAAGPHDDPAGVLAHWAHQAGYARRDGVPKVTKDTIGDGLYTFLLDGIDEQQPDGRTSLITTIDQLARRYPQHRWVLASRRVPELPSLALDGFVEYEIVPSHDWLLRYAAQRGVTPAELDEVAERAPGLGGLLQVPLFAAAAVAAVISKEELPTSPLQLLLTFASKGLDAEEVRLRNDPDQIDRWLDRVALTMLAGQLDGIDRAQTAAPALRGDLAEDVTINWLVARVLVAEQGSDVRFPTRTLRDARAARAVRDHPRGPEVLSELAVVELAGERHLRPGWQYVIDLLLTDDWNKWAGVLEPTDPLAVARSTPINVTAEERGDAAEVLYDWYRRHRIFIPRTQDGQLADDLAALAALAHDGLAPRMLGRMVSDLASRDIASRANAIAVLSATGYIDELDLHLRRLLTDSNSVVRRRAALAILDHKLSTYASILLERALTDDDELSRRTLASCAIEVADDAEIDAIIVGLPAPLRREAQLAIDRRWDRDEQLAHLASDNDADPDWLNHLVRSDGDTWTSAQVEALGELWQRIEPYHTDPTTQRVLLQHPMSALRGVLRALSRPSQPFDLLFLLDALSDEQLAAAEAGPEAADLLASYRELRRQPPRERTPPQRSRPPTAAADLGSMVQAGNLDDVLALRPSRDDVDALSPPDYLALVELAQKDWRDIRLGTSPLQRIQRVGDNQWIVHPRDWDFVHLALLVRLPLTEDEWLAAVDLSVSDNEQHESLLATYQSEWNERILVWLDELDDRGRTNLVRCLPGPWPDDVADALAERCFTSGLEEAQRYCADRLAADGKFELLRSWAGRESVRAIEVVLVGAGGGDGEAERRLLADYRDRNYPELHHWASDTEWIDLVSHRESAELVVDALRAMLRRGDQPHELGPLFKALNRCLGEAALEIYDDLIADDHIPDAPFLWYQRQDCATALAAMSQQNILTIAQRLFGDYL